MSLKDQMTTDLKAAMKSGDTQLRDVLRSLSAAVKQVEIDSRKDVTDDDVIAILKKEIKRRHESIADLQKAGREIIQENFELSVIEKYLPQQLSREQIKALAQEVVQELGVSSPKDMGNIMKALMPRLKGGADGKTVNEVVKELLT